MRSEREQNSGRKDANGGGGTQGARGRIGCFGFGLWALGAGNNDGDGQDGDDRREDGRSRAERRRRVKEVRNSCVIDDRLFLYPRQHGRQRAERRAVGGNKAALNSEETRKRKGNWRRRGGNFTEKTPKRRGRSADSMPPVQWAVTKAPSPVAQYRSAPSERLGLVPPLLVVGRP